MCELENGLHAKERRLLFFIKSAFHFSHLTHMASSASAALEALRRAWSSGVKPVPVIHATLFRHRSNALRSLSWLGGTTSGAVEDGEEALLGDDMVGGKFLRWWRR